jgi:hypothetical protein
VLLIRIVILACFPYKDCVFTQGNATSYVEFVNDIRNDQDMG